MNAWVVLAKPIKAAEPAMAMSPLKKFVWDRPATKDSIVSREFAVTRTSVGDDTSARGPMKARVFFWRSCASTAAPMASDSAMEKLPTTLPTSMTCVARTSTSGVAAAPDRSTTASSPIVASVMLSIWLNTAETSIAMSPESA